MAESRCVQVILKWFIRLLAVKKLEIQMPV